MAEFIPLWDLTLLDTNPKTIGNSMLMQNQFHTVKEVSCEANAFLELPSITWALMSASRNFQSTHFKPFLLDAGLQLASPAQL